MTLGRIHCINCARLFGAGIIMAWTVVAVSAAPAPLDVEAHDGQVEAQADGHAAGEGEAHGEHDPHLGAIGVQPNILDFRTDLAIYSLIVFVILLAVLAKFAWKPISAALEKREHAIAEHIAAAERGHEQAKQLLVEYEKKLAASHDEVRAIIDEARRDAQHTQEEIVAKARADAQNEIARGRREIETATDQAIKELSETSARLAVELAGKIIRAQLNPADHARLIDDAMSKFPVRMSGPN